MEVMHYTLIVREIPVYHLLLNKGLFKQLHVHHWLILTSILGDLKCTCTLAMAKSAWKYKIHLHVHTHIYQNNKERFKCKMLVRLANQVY